MTGDRQARAGVRTAAAVAVVAALVGALALGATQVVRLRADAKDRDERARVVRVVRDEVLALTDISSSTTDRQLDALLGRMTKRMKAEFAPQAGAFRAAMVSNKVQSQGRIVAVGLTSVSGRRATVVVAAAARVANKRTAADQDRSYRLRLRLEKVGTRWLVDSMEFVS